LEDSKAKYTASNLQLLFLRIRSKYPSLTDTSKKIADYILNNHNEAVYLSISELAQKVNVSESMITKFTRNMGYNGFHEFKLSLAVTSDQTKPNDFLYDEISLDDDIESICTKIYHNNIEALKDSLTILDFASLNKATDLLLKARKIDFYGSGSSTVAIVNAEMRIYRLGILCFAYSDSHAQAVSASLLQKDDVAVGISNSGRSIGIVKAMELAKQSGASTICITNYDDTPITRHSDLKLFTLTKDSEELCESLHSRIAELALVDALYVCLASKIKEKALYNLNRSSDAIKIHRTD
jgi:DNA-binding MurR/RpiR family transcriptional regulator